MTTDGALFGAHVNRNAYGQETVYSELEHVRGPGPRPPTTGPEDAAAPAWWWEEAERVVLALVTAGERVSSDDLHERFAHEPSATGASYGALFAGLARRGLIAEAGMMRSRRVQARGRRIVVWGAP